MNSICRERLPFVSYRRAYAAKLEAWHHGHPGSPGKYVVLSVGRVQGVLQKEQL